MNTEVLRKISRVYHICVSELVNIRSTTKKQPEAKTDISVKMAISMSQYQNGDISVYARMVIAISG